MGASADDLDALYAVDLDRFMETRSALAAAATKEGDRPAAARIKAARKPKLTAWVVNQLVREDPTGMEALLRAGDGVLQQHHRLLEGAPGATLRDADRAERQARDGLMPRARALFGRAGHTASPEDLRRVSQTLHAAAIGGGELRELVRRGRVTDDLTPPSVFEAPELPGARTASPSKRAAPPSEVARPPAPESASVAPAKEEGRPVSKARVAQDPHRAREEARQAARRAAEERRKQEAAERKAKKAAALAESRARRAQKARAARVKKAQAELRRLERVADQAERAASEARKRADAARAAVDRARAALGEL